MIHRKIGLRTVLLASAACLVGGTAAVAAPVYNWTGFYVGANAGGGVVSGHSDSEYYGAIAASGWGGVIGATAGYNFTFGNFVIGPEVDFS